MQSPPPSIVYAGEARVADTTATAALALVGDREPAVSRCRQLLADAPTPAIEDVLAAFPSTLVRIYALSTTRRASGNLEGGARVFADRSYANRAIATRNLQRLQRMLVDDRAGAAVELYVSPSSLAARQLTRGEIVWPGTPPHIAVDAGGDDLMWLGLAESLAADAARRLRGTQSDDGWEHARHMGHRIDFAVGIH